MSWGEHILGATILTLVLAIYILVLSLGEYKTYVGDIEFIKDGLQNCEQHLVLRSESCELVWRKIDE